MEADNSNPIAPDPTPVQHLYTSRKDNFLSWSEWVKAFGTPEENAMHDDPSMHNTEECKDLYKRWIDAEAITGHYQDGVLTWSVDGSVGSTS